MEARTAFFDAVVARLKTIPGVSDAALSTGTPPSQGGFSWGALEGEGAVSKLRTLMGATDPLKADAGTIRKEFGESIEQNAIHGSDSDENANGEIAYFFAQIELSGHGRPPSR